MDTQANTRDATGNPRMLRRLASALLLASSLGGHGLQAAETQVTSLLHGTHRFTIEAQPLGSALLSFGQQAGIPISVDSDLVKSHSASAVQGNLSGLQALEQLLGGTALGWTVTASDTLEIRPLGDTGSSIEDSLRIADLLVLGYEEQGLPGETIIDQRAIQAFPGANGDITTLLKMHPSVQFSSQQQSSNTPGEINPADISINGARYYQNNFMIDGININNDLDPGYHTFNSIRSFDTTPSRSHGIALDADLLQEVKVYDSNVPAEYGGFNGGVIDAITRRPTPDLHGKLSFAMSRSEWTNYHVIDGEEENFDHPTTGNYQPEFLKTTVRGTLEGHLSEDFGAILNFSQKRSTIPQYRYESGYAGDTKKTDQTRRIDNYLLKTYWNVNERLVLDGSLTYAPQKDYYFVENRIDSGFDLESGGWQGSLKGEWQGNHALWTHKLALTELESSRTAESNDYINWYYSSSKNWGSSSSSTSRSAEGSYGNLEQKQRGATYSLKSDWSPLFLLHTEHNLTSGLELSHQKATWERPNAASSTTAFRRDNGTSCDGVSDLCSIGDLVNGSTRQYSSLKIRYAAGKIEATENKYALYLQDRLQWGRLTLRPGLRFEGDDYMDKKTLAPRFVASYDLFDNQATVLSAGANRYYGRNLFKYRLADGRQALNTTMTRTSSTGNWNMITTANTNKFSSLDIPYDDELTLGIAQHWLETDFRLNYVRRYGRDQVVRAYANVTGLDYGDGVTYTKYYYLYTNAGRSDSDNVSLTITPQPTLDLAGSRTSFQLAADWSRTLSAYGNYDSAVDADEYADADVVYDGSIMRYSELPAADFNRPWTLRLTSITEIPALHLTWSNFFRYRGAYDQIESTSGTVEIDGISYDLYEKHRIKGAPTWDTRIHWERPTGKDQSLFVAVDITNVADKINRTSYSRSGATYTSYETGRQFWLEVGYRF
ncbi:TonB-dependent receptor [Stutzerimonas kirkiae]|uniref:TonB-dependent receptor n=1 Tax=Stutzerimonas kirkiae TaxID=2211392 RepID=A0A4Q9R6K5_9GAMM|nr:TonB-dependent receptor [Stutzerimonas kirkiae]TBU96025.1 TonB-dependent receptor [Stutzerimonas kirkiae]TBV03144.1 TonB-dependent receptor [Stutzerimonas kirkiae]TBV09773.1 TonB-dependent receptor [Stutzerimonas kirkiae]TBV13497.1 TonB-dependent receptor [Stutzerimonas kirkiae]